VPIQASFNADFRSFIDAANNATNKLHEFETDASKVQSSIDRIGKSFSGQKVIQEAELMTRAIGDVTEVTKLTAKEQARVNATLTEAIAKYRALGQEAPADMIKIADATKQVPKELNASADAAKALSGALAGMFSVQALISFGKDLLDTADQIAKVSDQTGLLTDEVQRLQYIGSQTGNGIEELTSAVGQMQNRLASGDDSALAALKRIGLSFDDLKNKDPYEQLIAISNGFDRVKNPAAQAQIAMDLFGKAGIAILPTLKAHMKELGDEAPVMSEATVRALDQAGDSFAKFGMQAKVWVAEAYNALGRGFDEMIAKVERWVAMVIDELKGLFEAFAKLPGVSKFFPGIQGAIKSLGETSQWFKDAASGLEHPIENVGKAAHGAIPPLEQFGKKTKEHKEKQDEAAKAAQAHAEKILALADAMRGLDTVRAATDALEALHLAQAGGFSIANMTIEQAKKLNATIQSAIDVYTAAGTTIPEEWLKVARETTIASIEINKGLDSVYATINKLKQVWVLPPLPTLDVTAGLPGGKLPGIDIGMPTIPKIDFFSKYFGDAKDFGAAMSAAITGAVSGGGGAGGAIGAAAGVAGSSIAGTLGKSLSSSFLKEGSGLFSQALGGVISSAIPFVGSMIGPLASKLWSSLFGTAGRTKVTDFAASFGGFDALHEKLNALGAEGEQLWIRLTQGTGRNNPEQAAANIDAVTKALDAYEQKQKDAAETATAAADAESAALKKVHDEAQAHVDGLNQQIKSLQDSIANEAPEEIMGVVEAQTRAQIESIEKQRDAAQQAIDQTTEQSADAAAQAAKDIDEALKNRHYEIDVDVNLRGLPPGSSPTGGGGGGGSGRSVPFGATIGGAVGVTQTLSVQIGDDVIARAAVRGMPKQFALQGL